MFIFSDHSIWPEKDLALIWNVTDSPVSRYGQSHVGKTRNDDNATDSLPVEFAAIPAKPEIGQSAIGEFDPGLRPLPPEHLLGLSWTHFIELIRIDDPLRPFTKRNVFTDTGRSARSNARSDLSCTSVPASRPTRNPSSAELARRTRPPLSPRSCAIRTFSNSRGSPNGPGIARRISSPPSSIICKHSSWNRAPAFVLKPGRNGSPSAMSTQKQLLVISLSDEKACRLAKTCRKNSGRRA